MKKGRKETFNKLTRILWEFEIYDKIIIKIQENIFRRSIMETMLETKQNSELKNIFDKIQNLCRSSQLKSYRIGLAGSYFRGDENEKSDIDIIVDTDMLQLEQIEFIRSQFDKEVDVVQLKLLESEDKKIG